jgi:hypothetical protein
MKIACARSRKDFIELMVLGDMVDITVTQNTGDRRSDESTVMITQLDAMRLSEALRRFAVGKSLEK